MERALRFGLALLFVLLLSPAIADEKDPDWKLVSDRNEIQVYMKHRDESRLKTFRGVTRFELKDEFALVAVLNDYPSIPKWLHFIDSAEEFDRRDPLDRSLRFTTQLPWPLADREAVLRADVHQTLNEEEQSVMIELINQPDALPPNNDYIRFPEMWGKLGFVRLGNDQVEMTYEVILDPGGYIPAWIANILLRDAPYFTLERLRRVIRKPEYQNQYFDYLPDLHGPGHPDNKTSVASQNNS
ncbi:START domain-containing protein [Alcanivorax sp. S6407]|uniref:START domain-containing protein n=1 Tax=Alcanivorax sp. S6407 TaxID=2926424 RepID=UPI001FF26A28|nr:START domain-containing protein [Alcanivorax sp. S6407]MCK0153222.1 START domain-containing protein [Alcanivorax sp. S6407]